MNNKPLFVNIEEEDTHVDVYRIISLERLFELFVRKKSALVRPKLWKDPWENLVFQSRASVGGTVGSFADRNKIYGQCWTYHRASDAMWQIYSPDGKGVRIRTKIHKLSEMLSNQLREWTLSQSAIGNVDYLRDHQIKKYLKNPFSNGLNPTDYFKTLLVKRNAFIHENELRILFLAQPSNDSKQWFSPCRNLFFCEFDPHFMIDQIMLHPAMEKSMAGVLKQVISDATNYPIDQIKRSLLYCAPALGDIPIR